MFLFLITSARTTGIGNSAFCPTVPSNMFLLRNQLQVINGIVQFVSVDMVDNFLRKWKQLSAEIFFHYKTMFKALCKYPVALTISVSNISTAVFRFNSVRSSINKIHSVMRFTHALGMDLVSLASIYFAQPTSNLLPRTHIRNTEPLQSNLQGFFVLHSPSLA